MLAVEVGEERVEDGGGACSHGNCAVSTSVRVMHCPLSSASRGLSPPQLDMTACAHMQETHTLAQKYTHRRCPDPVAMATTEAPPAHGMLL